MTQQEINELLGVKTYNLLDLRQKFRTFLIHGPVGVGKTSQARYLPQCLFYNIERGDASLYGGDITAVDVRSWKKFGAVTKRVVDLQNEGKNPFLNIFIDSATELAKIHLRAMAAEDAKSNANLSPNQPMLSRYLDAMVDHDNMLMWFKDVQLNVIFTAISEYEKDDLGKMLWLPKMPKSIRDSFFQYSDGIIYLDKDMEGNRYFLTQGTPNISAKLRNPLHMTPVPTKVYNPNVADIIRYFQGDESVTFATAPTGEAKP